MTNEEAIDVIRDYLVNKVDNEPMQKACQLAIKALSAEPQERRTGRWIAVDSYSAYGGSRYLWELHGNPIAFHYCSNCKEQAYCDDDGEELLSNYCPDCGGKDGSGQ